MLAWIFPKGPGSHPVTGGTIINKEIAYHIARFPDGTIRRAFRNEDPGWRWADTGYIATEGEWTHLAVVYEDGTVSTYAGGSLVHQSKGWGLSNNSSVAVWAISGSDAGKDRARISMA